MYKDGLPRQNALLVFFIRGSGGFFLAPFRIFEVPFLLFFRASCTARDTFCCLSHCFLPHSLISCLFFALSAFFSRSFSRFLPRALFPCSFARLFTMRVKSNKPNNQRGIAAYFSVVTPKKKVSTPEKVIIGRSESRLPQVTSRSAFEEIPSSDTSFGSPEVNNFRNPTLSRYSTGLPKKKNDILFVGSDSEDEKENKRPVRSSPLKPTLKREASDLNAILDGQPKRKLWKTPSVSTAPLYTKGLVLSLSEEQKAIINYVVNRGENVFFTGSAGTGKSVVLRHLVQELCRKHGQVNVGVTASTGLAACNISGQTVHKYLSIGLGTGSPQELANKIKKNGPAKKRWQSMVVLIIDEILMIDGKLFTKLDEIAKVIRNNQAPFGGIQLVCTGDFFQLPPVSKDNSGQYCFQSPSWSRAMTHTITLTQVFRQKGDSELIDMLNALRKGDLDENMIAKFHLLKRRVAYTDGIEPTELFPTRQEVKRANESRLQHLQGQSNVYAASDSDKDPNLKRLYENLMCEEKVELKEGAQVMYLKNHPDNVVVNGSIGTVLGFMTEGLWGHVCSIFGIRELIDPSPQFLLTLRLLCGLAGRTNYTDEQRAMYELVPTEWRSKVTKIAHEAFQVAPGTELLPVVNFKTGNDSFSVILVRREEFSVDQGRVRLQGKPEKLVREQVPLLLAWAMSIHKAQGQSIDRLRVDLRKIFEKGQVYVALSRATNKEHLEVLNFDHRRITVSKEVREFYNSLGVHKE